MYSQQPAACQHRSLAPVGGELLPAGCCCSPYMTIEPPVLANHHRSSSMRSSSSPRLLLAAAATSSACLALVLAVGVCTAATCGGGLAVHGRRQLRPPSSPVLGVDDSLVSAPALEDKQGFAAAGDAAAARDLLGAAAGQDYGFVDPPPDTVRRGRSAPIPHS